MQGLGLNPQCKERKKGRGEKERERKENANGELKTANEMQSVKAYGRQSA